MEKTSFEQEIFEQEIEQKVKSLSGGSLAGGNSKRGRVDNDFYATDPASVVALLNAFDFKGSSFLEPCAGTGNISEVLKSYFPDADVVSTDLIDRGYCEGGIDFLIHNYDRTFDNVITNPPFKLAKEFIEKSLEITNEGGYVAMFLKVQFLEGTGRREMLENGSLKYVYVFSGRQAPWRGGNPLNEKGKKWSSTMCFAWFIFQKGYSGEKIIRWL